MKIKNVIKSSFFRKMKRNYYGVECDSPTEFRNIILFLKSRGCEANTPIYKKIKSYPYNNVGEMIKKRGLSVYLENYKIKVTGNVLEEDINYYRVRGKNNIIY